MKPNTGKFLALCQEKQQKYKHSAHKTLQETTKCHTFAADSLQNVSKDKENGRQIVIKKLLNCK